MCVVFTSILVRNQGEMPDFLHHLYGGQMRECGNQVAKLTLRAPESGALQQKVFRSRKTQADKLR